MGCWFKKDTERVAGSKDFIRRVINAMGRQTINIVGNLWKIHILAPMANIIARLLKRGVRVLVTKVIVCMLFQLSEDGEISQWEPSVSLLIPWLETGKRVGSRMHYYQYLLCEVRNLGT